MAVKKAFKKAHGRPTKATKARKAVKATVPPVKKKKKKETPLAYTIYKSIIETLEHNSLGGGEYDLPSILTRVLDRSDPRYKLGLHREYYIPISGTAPYNRVGESGLRTMLSNQAGLVLPAFGEGIKVKKVDPDLPLCEDCK
jgi:hypothetical protein